MVNLLPVFALFISAGLILLLGHLVLPIGRTWMLAAILAFSVWVSMIVIGILKPAGFVVENWLQSSNSPQQMQLSLSNEAWFVGFLWVSLLVAVIFAEAKDLQDKSNITILSGELLLSAVGLLAIIAGSNLAYLLTWALMDMVEYGILIWIIKDPIAHKNSIYALVSRLLGILLLVFIVSTGDGGSVNENLIGVLTLVIVILRTGIIPVHRPFVNNIALRRGIGTILRFTPPLSAAAFLISRGTLQIGQPASTVMLVLLAIGMLYGSLMWQFSQNELEGRPYWIISIACLMVTASVMQAWHAVVGLTAMLVVGGGAQFLYSPRFRRPLLYLIPLLIGIIALPYSPTSSVRSMLWGESNTPIYLVPVFSVLILLFGVTKHFLRQEPQQYLMESWMRFIYIVGMAFLLVTPWIGGIILGDQGLGLGFWGISVFLAIGLISELIAMFIIKQKRIIVPARISGLLEGTSAAMIGVNRFFKFSWFSNFREGIFSATGRVIGISIKILEGDGGILWSILFLVLIASLILTLGFPR